MTKDKKPTVFIIDVDGCMTSGEFYYTADGKVMKVFGADDADGLSLLKKHMEIRFVSADKRGFPISKKRIFEDMGYPLDLVSSSERLRWIKEQYSLEEAIYMGDGIFDAGILKAVAYGIAPQNSNDIAKKAADLVTKRSGGDRAVCEACLEILDRFFDASPIDRII